MTVTILRRSTGVRAAISPVFDPILIAASVAKKEVEEARRSDA